jgi:hypothetical protein
LWRKFYLFGLAFFSNAKACVGKSGPTPRAPDKRGHSPTLSGKRPQTADSASGGFIRQIPPLPVTPAVETVEKVLFQNGALESGTKSSKSVLFLCSKCRFRDFCPRF